MRASGAAPGRPFFPRPLSLFVGVTDSRPHSRARPCRWYGWRDLNPRPHAPKACALPTAPHPYTQQPSLFAFSGLSDEPGRLRGVRSSPPPALAGERFLKTAAARNFSTPTPQTSRVPLSLYPRVQGNTPRTLARKRVRSLFTSFDTHRLCLASRCYPIRAGNWWAHSDLNGESRAYEALALTLAPCAHVMACNLRKIGPLINGWL